MSNSIDMLLIGGPVHGRIVNGKRPVVPFIEVVRDGEVLQYTMQIYSVDGKHYRVAAYAGTTGPEIAAAVIAYGIEPAWDLRPPYGNYTPPAGGGDSGESND